MFNPSSFRRPEEERRKYPRVEKHFIITYYEANKPDADHNVSQLKNISQGGVCFTSCAAYPAGTKLHVLIKTPYLAETLNVNGEVVSCIEKISGVIHEIHLQILELEGEVANIFKKIEKSFLESQNNPQV